MNSITCIVRVDLLVYAIILNIILLLYLTSEDSRSSYSLKLFKRVLVAIIFVSCAETVTWLTGEIGNTAQIPIHYWGNAIYLPTVALPESLGFAYLDYKMFGNEEQNKRRLLIYLIPTFLGILFGIYNLFNNGFFFYISDSNQYFRGPSAYFNLGFAVFFLGLVLIYFYRYKHMITGRLTQAIIIFSLTPVVGSVLQMMNYGTTFTMPSYTLALFMSFLILERDELAKDPLTRLYTRKSLENRIRFKLRANEPFSVILIDLNDFKMINDKYGHLEGDRVLQVVADVLVQCTSIEDMVCRYGGDEFFLLIEFKEDIGKKVIERIEHGFERYSNRTHKYDVSGSFGHIYVQNPSLTDFETLISEADNKMYEDKLKRKQKNTYSTE